MTTAEKIAEQVESASNAISKCGYTVPAVIKATRLSAKSRKVHFGFHFEAGLSLGDRGSSADGSVYEVVAIVTP